MAASISAAGLLDSWGQDQIPRLEQPLQSLLLANGINQTDTGALDDLSYPDIESDCDIGSQSDFEMHFSGKRTAMELDRSDGPGQFSWLCNYLSGSLNSISSSTVVPGVANLDENDQCSSDARVHSSSQPLYLAMRL
eukprot:g80741.t1